MSRYFLDTNALIDLVFVRNPEVHASMVAIAELCNPEIDELLVSTLSLKDASYILESSKLYRDAPLLPEERRERSAFLRSIAFEYCRICSVDEPIARSAHANRTEHDYDDALIAESALSYGADAIVSSDKRAFKSSVVPKMTPQELAKAMRVLRSR